MLHVALYEPEIPPNTGNVARLCAATFTELHIVGVTGFRMDDRTLKRAGLDYWDHVRLRRHIDLERLYEALPDSRFLYIETKSERLYTDFQFQKTIVSCSDARRAACRKKFWRRTASAVFQSQCRTKTCAV